MIRVTLLLFLIALVARQLALVAVPRTAERPLTPDEQALKVVQQKGRWFETVVFRWLITIVLLHTLLSIAYNPYRNVAHTDAPGLLQGRCEG
jgi:hypothetical protein